MSVSYGQQATASGNIPAPLIKQSYASRAFSRPDLSNHYLNAVSNHYELTGAYYDKSYPYYPNAPTYQMITKTAGVAPQRVRGDLVPQNVRFSRSYLGTGMLKQRPTSNKIHY
jgi:hypothetical protein